MAVSTLFLLPRNWLQSFLILLFTPIVADACPELRYLYPSSDSEWSEQLGPIEELFDQCLESSEYFALLGAAQLNTGNLERAIESLERSLLLNPDNGAALIDYGTALFEDGQLFAALEIVSLLLERDDMPEGLEEQVIERQKRWQALTRQTFLQLDLGGGFDNNLNGGPNDSEIALTLSGEPIFLSLNEEFRSAAGKFFNAGLASRHIRLTPSSQHLFSGLIRGRLSENRASDVVQFTGRYNNLSDRRRTVWRQGVGFSHLSFSGKALFTGLDLRQRMEFPSDSSSCSRYLGGALQHQTWHSQRRLDGIEVKVGIGGSCNLGTTREQAFTGEVNYIKNLSVNNDRLGGDRDGWQFLGQWQRMLGSGLVSAQAEIGFLLDRNGYSRLLDNNSRRRVSRHSLLLQYRYPARAFGNEFDFLLNLFHQDQKSNINLFESVDTSIELGLSFSF